MYEIADVRAKRLEDQAPRGVDHLYQIFLSKRSSMFEFHGYPWPPIVGSKN
jgi:hypothetical protein